MKAKFTNRQIEIIEAAGKILTRVGVSGLTTKNLAKEMKFSESAIYRHFSGKEAIIIAMLSHLETTMDEGLTNAMRQDADPIEKFLSLFHQQLEFFNARPYFMVAVFSDGLMEESAGVNEAIFKIMAVKGRHLKPIIEEGQQKGLFSNEITGDALVLIVMGSFRLQMFRWRVANFEFDIVATGKSMIQSLLTLIKK